MRQDHKYLTRKLQKNAFHDIVTQPVINRCLINEVLPQHCLIKLLIKGLSIYYISDSKLISKFSYNIGTNRVGAKLNSKGDKSPVLLVKSPRVKWKTIIFSSLLIPKL